jgi:hypothetical protein
MKKIVMTMTACCLLAGALPARAQTMSFADAISQLASACSADLAKYCKGVEMGQGRLKACLDANQARLSPRCQQTQAAVYASIARRINAQRTIGSVCSADIARLCGVYPADGNLVTCLSGVMPVAISPACNQVFTDTGWRTERAQQ